MTQKFRTKTGDCEIANMLFPKPHEMDLEAIDGRLKTMKRFAGNPLALSVWDHCKLVVRLVEMDRKLGFDDGPEGYAVWQDVCEWAKHHDDHEGVIGDIIAPVKAMISSETDILHRAEIALDHAICIARDIKYPSEMVKGLVHRYDKAAETLEWVYALGQPLADHNHPCPDHLFMQGRTLIQWARGASA